MAAPLRIKLLHERRNHATHRKCEGRSGAKYLFHWDDAVMAYCYAPKDQKEADDLFNGQGRGSGCYFAPIVEKAADKPAIATGSEIPPDLLLELLRLEIALPEKNTDEAIAQALIAAHLKGVGKGERARDHAVRSRPTTAPFGAVIASMEVAASMLERASDTAAESPATVTGSSGAESSVTVVAPPVADPAPAPEPVPAPAKPNRAGKGKPTPPATPAGPK